MKPSYPSIDHTLLSPSGRASNRARKAAMKREAACLFPPGYWDQPEPTQAEKDKSKAARLAATARNLRELADRGMSPRRFRKAAERLEAEIQELTSQ